MIRSESLIFCQNLNFVLSRCRTLTSVYDSILEDLVFPAEIVGKRVRIRLDGSRFIKVHLDKIQQTTIEHKVPFFYQYTNSYTCRMFKTIFRYVSGGHFPIGLQEAHWPRSQL